MPRSWSNKQNFSLLLLSIVAMVGAALFLMLPIRGSNLTTGAAGWTAHGCFSQGGVYPATSFDRQITAHERQGVTLWGSYCGDDANTAELHSPPFKTPTILEIFVSGTEKPGLNLFLEREDNHVRLPLFMGRLSVEVWRKLRVWLPSEWRGQQVHLVAIDQSTAVGGWIAVSNPRSLSVFNFFRQQWRSWFRAVATYLYQLALFLLPGFAVASLLTARRQTPLSPVYLVMVVICTSAALGYLSFWVFFFSKPFGRILSFTLYLAAAGLLVFPIVCPRTAVKTTASLIRQPFLLMTLAGLCYTSFYFIFNDPFVTGIGYASDRFFTQILAGDNVIPAIFADRIYDQKPLIPFCCDDWLSSDRPPLQTGIVLMERPLGVLNDTELSYQLLGSALQSVWICGVWCLLTSIGVTPKHVSQILGFLIFSGFLFYNTVYVWPKLLAATCILFLLTILFELGRSKRTLTNLKAALAAACFGLALMAHPGSIFSLVVFVFLLVRLKQSFSLRQAGMAFVIVTAFYLPWTLYQKYVDPPGNRLLKVHLAGIIPVDPRTTWQAVKDSYGAHTWQEIVIYKWTNIKFLVGEDPLDGFGLNAVHGIGINHDATGKSRNSQRFFMWNAAGLVNFGWLAGLYLLLKHKRLDCVIPYAGWLVAAALANLVFWSIVTFGPYETQTAHSSYADILLASIGLLGFILQLPRIIFVSLSAWQLLNFFVVWVWSLPARIPPPITFQWPMMISGVALTLLLVWLTFRPSAEQAENSPL